MDKSEDLKERLEAAKHNVLLPLLTEARSHIETLEAEIKKLNSYAENYCLLRRVHMSQAKGNYDDGQKLQIVMTEGGQPRNTREFDERMVRAAKLIQRD